MSALAQLSASECELLYSLPYRAGLFISHADDVDGGADDAAELQALQEAMKAVAGLETHAGVTAEIFNQCLRLRSEWPRWEAKAFTTPEDAKAARMMMVQKFGEPTARDFSAALMEVGTSVARAAGEYDRFEDHARQADGFLGALMQKIVGGFAGLAEDDSGHPMNVSAAEDTALATLARALKTEV